MAGGRRAAGVLDLRECRKSTGPMARPPAPGALCLWPTAVRRHSRQPFGVPVASSKNEVDWNFWKIKWI